MRKRSRLTSNSPNLVLSREMRPIFQITHEERRDDKNFSNKEFFNKKFIILKEMNSKYLF